MKSWSIMSKFELSLIIALGINLLLASCNQRNITNIEGSVDYSGSSEIYIEKQPLHYKYSPKKRYPIHPDNQGNFTQPVPGSTNEIVFFTIDDQAYPVILRPGKTIHLTIRRAFFPDSVTVKGYPYDWNKLYAAYWEREQQIMESIQNELPAFREGKETDVLDLYRERIMLAKRYLGDSPLDYYYHRAIGEYLVKRLEFIKHKRGTPGFNPEKERQRVIDEAKKLNFFSFELLKDQRAGIRDFTNAYANTFGVEKKIEEEYGRDLMKYDVKRLGYETLDSARTSVLNHIEDRKALAYAKMHLIAERIGEMSPEVAKSSYESFLKEFDEFPEYTSFLRTFYNEVKSVSPGQPAIPFTLPNQYGEEVSMKDFKGKYVLLDFWASWCIPCLDEFPHMKKIYNDYSREDFEIVAISIEEDSLKWRKALKQFNNPWIQLYGGNEFQQKTFKAYRGGGIPFYILVNRQGNIERYNDIRPSFNLPDVLDSLITSENR